MHDINTISIDTIAKFIRLENDYTERDIPSHKNGKESVAYELVDLLDSSEIAWGEIRLIINHFDTNLTTEGNVRFQTLEKALEVVHSWYYDSGYGAQELFGTIVMQDGSWYTRHQYDGSESWEHHTVPKTPEWAKEL